MIRVIQRTLLYCILISLISQLGKHYWPDFSYVSGIRVDYLSPTVYFSDLLTGLLFIVSFPTVSKVSMQTIKNASKIHLLGAFALILSSLIALQPIVALLGFLKLIEMVFVGHMVRSVFSKQDFPVIARVLAGAVFTQSTLAIWQVVTKSSVGGIWYFLGERSFSSATLGISTVSMYGNEILRAYGSFPHPNVLAFFMLFSALLLITYTSQAMHKAEKVIIYSAVALAVIVLFLTFSRITILIFIVSLGWMLLKHKIPRKVGMILIVSSVLGAMLLAPRFLSNIFNSEDLISRLELVAISLSIIKEYPFFGVGLSNYFIFQMPYQREITHVLLQPVHNIYLLTILQVGLVGLVPVMYFIYQTLKRVKNRWSANNFTAVNAMLFISILIIGITDHFFLTLQQGMLMTAVVTGLVWLPDEDK